MDESQKRVIVIVVAVLAVLAACYSAYRVYTADQLQVGVQHAPMKTSMKQMEMERQAKEDAALKAGNPVKVEQERDLSGGPGGPGAMRGKGD